MRSEKTGSFIHNKNSGDEKMNVLFEAAKRETDPMYDVSVIDDGGIQFERLSPCNNANNSHSVTKFFVAAAIGTLVDKGLLREDTKILPLFDKEELPENMSEGWKDVTVALAMQHKTGIANVPYGIDYDESMEGCGDDFLKYVFSLKIEYAPGTHHKYSDEVYYLLGIVIHKVTGMTADVYMRENIFKPLGFRQWAMVKCPDGHPICGGGFFARSDDIAKLGYTYACKGIYNGKRIVSSEWVDKAMRLDYGCNEFRNTGIFLKTGAQGQVVAFSQKHRAACAWHGWSNDGGNRNDRLLEAFAQYLNVDEALYK